MIVKSRAFPFPLALASVLACDGGEGGRAVNIPCAAPGDSAVATAVAEYVRSLEPQPRRFLMIPSGDGRLPDVAQTRLRSLGPTYLFPADSAQQRTVAEQLAKVGSFVTVLVRYEGMQQPGEESVAVRFSGRYIGGQQDGTVAPTKEVGLVCDLGQWKAHSADEEAAT